MRRWWRIDRTRPPGEAAEQLFRKEFKAAGQFSYAVSTPIKKLSDRTHFCITYGTRHPKGIEVYRNVEHRALRQHEFRRLESRLAKEAASGKPQLFGADDLDAARAFDALCVQEQVAAEQWLQQRLAGRSGGEYFETVWPEMLEAFMVRRTHARDIGVALAKRGVLEPTWKARGPKVKKPDDGDLLVLRAPALVVPF